MVPHDLAECEQQAQRHGGTEDDDVTRGLAGSSARTEC
jgi:hypothetical protein